MKCIGGEGVKTEGKKQKQNKDPVIYTLVGFLGESGLGQCGTNKLIVTSIILGKRIASSF